MMSDAPDWLVDFLDGISLWDAIAITLVLAGVVTFIWKRGWRSVTAMARGVINAAQILEAVQGLPKYITDSKAQYARLEKKVDDIHHETHNNNGSSIKDSQDRTEAAVAALREQVTGVETGIEGLHGRMDSVERAVDTLTKEDDAIWAALDDTQNPHEGDQS